MVEAREIRLAKRPTGIPTADCFELATTSLGEPGPGEVLIRNQWLSVDPYMRGRMIDQPSYVPPFQLGKALQGGALGEVVKSNAPGFKPGDFVSSMYGWREAYVAPAEFLEKISRMKDVPDQAWLGVMGMPGMAAWAGLHEIGEPKEGQTLLVSGGAGAVGSLVAQMGKIRGMTVVATAGSPEKCDWLKSLGIKAVNYKSGPLLGAIKAAAPRGIDIYFDNVGGEHLEVAIHVARTGARFVECGMISGYNEEVPGPRNTMMIVTKALKIQGFIVTQFMPLKSKFEAEMAGWIQAGKIQWQETIVDGLDAMPVAFNGLFTGQNTGKMLIRL